ncbi:hypothetical protein RIN66_21920 (plasmid) [Hafnia alvei]|uniref:hypothetical protein n=1 Tax=Hafnia alvei TaxID=569 RepID=UPI0028BF27AC|nr:hypothetical protein [Hafnia alvei]WNN54769.1 hypothetical protein RIN66_21920 [Hafnia alvei]
MKDAEINHVHEIDAAKTAIANGVRNLMASGWVNNREGIIRSFMGVGLDMAEVSELSITVCSPEKPDITITQEGYLFSQLFQLNH